MGPAYSGAARGARVDGELAGIDLGKQLLADAAIAEDAGQNAAGHESEHGEPVLEAKPQAAVVDAGESGEEPVERRRDGENEADDKHNAAGDAGTMLPIDAIDEFRTEQNPEAQYGWKPGGVINVGVKSGTNNIHGTAYAYGRSNSFDARSFFNPPPVNGVCAVGPLAACDQAALNLEQFGASIGGPIIKDKLFYFANYEQQQYTNGNPAPHFVPVTTGPGALDSGDGLIGACLEIKGTGPRGTRVTCAVPVEGRPRT